MMRRFPPVLYAVPVLAALVGGALAGSALLAQAQLVSGLDDVNQTRAALVEARSQASRAAARAEKLEAEAATANAAAERTAQEGAALAARIQQTQAEMAGHQARIRLIDHQREDLRARLAERQAPVVRLTAALQRLSRRPLALALLRPGSVRDTMHMRALLATMLPEVERRTRALRAEIDRSRVLQQAEGAAAQDLAASRRQLDGRRQALVALETRQRLAARGASGIADRESERALALAEQARDLGGLIDELGKSGALREQLGQLPGPVIRPPRPAESQVLQTETAPAAIPSLAGYMLPVDGRLVAGFGDSTPGAPRSRGISIAALGGAQAVAPAAGRVAFAGPYTGYGNIIIIEHPGGWTSLITGLAQLDARVGQQIAAGGPLGIAGPGRPVLTVELRRDGTAVNPLDYLKG